MLEKTIYNPVNERIEVKKLPGEFLFPKNRKSKTNNLKRILEIFSIIIGCLKLKLEYIDHSISFFS